MRIAWVIGGGGLLGSALRRSLQFDGTELFSPPERFRWGSEPELAPQVAAAVQAFANRVHAARRWEIYWAAGLGTMGSPESELAPETRALALLLRQVESESRLMAMPGNIAFASSAGAIYAGSSAYIITEDTGAAPTTAYAREKLRQEDLVRSFVLANSQTTALLARFSTLYGPGQSLGKRQGLVAHIARCILRNQVIQIYVPFDTIRDYIAAGEAAAAMAAALRSTSEKPRVLMKIVASERPTTIAEIISVFRRIARRPPRIVTSASNLSSLYSRRVLFQSKVLQESTPAVRISLFVGISQVMTAERLAFARNPGLRQ
jgi:UDP-glucose 4-epimerase